MFKSRTVFIVGAGASHELKMPLGSELKSQIASLLQFDDRCRHKGGDRVLDLAFQAYSNTERIALENLAGAADKVADAMPLAPSIDEYLHAMKHDRAKVIAGKTAIVRCILSAERASSLVPDERFVARSRGNLSKKFPNCWLLLFFQRLVSGVQKGADLNRLFDNVAFIVFNYDRCVETFLYRALQVYYEMSASKAGELLRNVQFVHPYGTVGQLPWQVDGDASIGYGEEPRWDHVVAASNGIRIFSDDRDSSMPIGELGKLVGAATTVVFLGLSYGEQNLELLTMPKGAGPPERAFGTVRGFSSDDQGKISDELHATFNVRRDLEFARLFDGSCQELFWQYSKSIAR